MSHPLLETIDREYRDRVSKAIVEAVLLASLDPSGKVAIIRSGEVIEALLDLLALYSATSDATSSPTKRRQFTETVSKRLFRLIGAARQEIAEGGSPMTVVTEPSAGPPN